MVEQASEDVLLENLGENLPQLAVGFNKVTPCMGVPDQDMQHHIENLSFSTAKGSMVNSSFFLKVTVITKTQKEYKVKYPIVIQEFSHRHFEGPFSKIETQRKLFPKAFKPIPMPGSHFDLNVYTTVSSTGSPDKVKGSQGGAFSPSQ
jgi:hypothetical protein